MTRTPIIPYKQKFHNEDFEEVQWNDLYSKRSDLDLKAIAVFCTTGIFPGTDTYYKGIKTYQPATEIRDGKEIPYFDWHYSPRDITLEKATEEFAELFERISFSSVRDKKVVLPLSGGLDSRSQAVSLLKHQQVNAFTYQFHNGKPEIYYGKRIAETAGFPFKSFEIRGDYLWKKIEELADINHCFSDFTHGRQMAIRGNIRPLGEIIHLGHWGDVLFDGFDIRENASEEEQIEFLKSKFIRKKGLFLGRKLWEAWGLEGNIDNHLTEIYGNLLRPIKIDHAVARIRAFKSLYWAPRWTNVNTNVFGAEGEVIFPYFENDMCRFICTLPEELLAGRKIQIEYIKKYSPEIAGIPWQDYHPFNLFNYGNFRSSWYLPFRAVKKARRLFGEKVLGKPQVTQRNWELQFNGRQNRKKLESYLLSDHLADLVPPEITRDVINKFDEEDAVQYSHPLSMLLTLSLFSKRNFR